MTDKIDTSGRAPAPAVPEACVSSVSYTPWNPVPRATVPGAIATAVVYTLSLTVVFAIAPTSTPWLSRYPREAG